MNRARSRLALAVVFCLTFCLSGIAAHAQSQSWTGFYGGVFLGDAWAPKSDFAGQPSALALPSGPSVGGQLGLNLRSGLLVYGLEGDLAIPDLEDLPWCTGGGPRCSDSPHEFIGSLRARGGFVFDRVLVYGTAGYAFSNLQRNPSVDFSDMGRVFRDGWTLGGGVEFALSEHVGTSLEYRRTYFSDVGPDAVNPARPENNTVMLRLNFH